MLKLFSSLYFHSENEQKFLVFNERMKFVKGVNFES